jgi:hypothetical protein
LRKLLRDVGRQLLDLAIEQHFFASGVRLKRFGEPSNVLFPQGVELDANAHVGEQMPDRIVFDAQTRRLLWVRALQGR